MAPSNDGNPEPTERTSLLRESDESSGSKPTYSNPDDGIATGVRPSSNGHGSILKNGDLIKIDLSSKRVDLLLDDEDIAVRKKKTNFSFPENQTPWQEISRKFTGQLSNGACMDLEENYFDIARTKGIPRDNH